MSRLTHCLSATLVMAVASVLSAQASPPQRITGPVSVEPRMTVEQPGTESDRLLPQPPVRPESLETPDVAAETPEPASPDQPASAETIEANTESRPLPAIERVPLGQGAVGSGSEDGAERSRFDGIAQTVGALAVVIGLILILRFVFVKLSGTAGGLRAQLGAAGKAPSGVLFVLGRYPVSRGMSLVLLQLDQRVLLLSQTGDGFHTLAELSDPTEVASIIQKTRDESGESISAKFTGLLKQFERDPETLADMDSAAPSQPVRLRHTGTDAPIDEPLSPRRVGGYYEDKPAPTTGEDELRSRINRLREFGS